MSEFGFIDTDAPLEDGLLHTLKGFEERVNAGEGWDMPPALGCVYRREMPTEFVPDELREDAILYMFEAKLLVDMGEGRYRGRHPVEVMRGLADMLKKTAQRPVPDNLQCFFLLSEAWTVYSGNEEDNAKAEKLARKGKLERHPKRKEARFIQAVDITDTVYMVMRIRGASTVRAVSGGIDSEDRVSFGGAIPAALRELVQVAITEPS